MLVSYIINSNPDVQFFSIAKIDELYQIYKPECSQVYFFDDFFGDVKYNFQISTNEQTQLLNFINYLKEFDNKWFVLTTREYVLHDGLNLNKKIKDKFLDYKFNLDIKDISNVSKANIYFNHIKEKNLLWEHQYVLFNCWKNIVYNSNYTPRLIETFLDKYNYYNELSGIDFFDKFTSYLNCPYDFWEEILVKQPFEVIVLLLIIALSDELVEVNVLNYRFGILVNSINVNKNNDLCFNDYIKKLEDTFALTRVYDNKLIIELKNPSYRDFLLDYLSKNVSLYISYIYNKNNSFRQLINLWGIINKNYDLYKNLDEVRKLDEVIFLRFFDEDITSNYLNFIDLAELTDFNFETKIKKMIVSKVIDLLENADDYIYDDSDNYNILFPLLDALKDKFDFTAYIYDLLSVVTYESGCFDDIEKLARLKSIYPVIFKEFYNEHKVDIKKNLHNLIIWDALYYQKNNDRFSFEVLVYEEVPNIYRELNISVPVKLKQEIKEIEKNVCDLFDESDLLKDIISSNNNSKDKNDIVNEEEIIENKVNELTGGSNFVDDVSKYLSDNNVPLKIRKIIKNIEDSEDNDDRLLHSLIKNRQMLSLLCSFLENNNINEDKSLFLRMYVDYIVSKNNLSEENYYHICSLAFVLMNNNKSIFTISDLKEYIELNFDRINFDEILNSDFFIKRGNWYHFVHPIIQSYLFFYEVKKTDKNVDIMYLTKTCYKFDRTWRFIDYYDYDEIMTFRLLSLLFKERWNSFVIDLVSDFLTKINTKDDISIAKSIIKYFNLNISYSNYATTINYDDYLLHDILFMYLGETIMNLFVLDCYSHSEKMVSLYEKHKGVTDDDVLIVNNYLNSKKFIDMLTENNIINEINIYYNKVVSLVQKLKNENENVVCC